MIRNDIDQNNPLPAKNQLYVFGLLSAVWVGIVYLSPKAGGVFGYMDTVIGLALTSIWVGVIYHFIAKDIDRREKLEQLARDLQHSEVRYLLDQFGPLKELLSDREFKTFKHTGPNLTLTLFVALAAVTLLFLLT
jgi:hypothetical protein